MAVMYTPAWFEELASKLKGNSQFTEGMRKWEGEVAVGVRPMPQFGSNEELYWKMDPSGGEIKVIGFCNKSEAEKAKVCLLLDHATYKDLGTGKIGLGKVMTNRETSIKGTMYAVKHLKTLSTMVSAVQTLSTVFPEDLSEKELDDFKKWVRELQAEVGAQTRD